MSLIEENLNGYQTGVAAFNVFNSVYSAQIFKICLAMYADRINETIVLVLLHSTHVDVEPKYKATSIRHLVLRQILDRHYCNNKSIFEDKQAQIAKSSCAQPEENK